MSSATVRVWVPEVWLATSSSLMWRHHSAPASEFWLERRDEIINRYRVRSELLFFRKHILHSNSEARQRSAVRDNCLNSQSLKMPTGLDKMMKSKVCLPTTEQRRSKLRYANSRHLRTWSWVSSRFNDGNSMCRLLTAFSSSIWGSRSSCSGMVNMGRRHVSR